ncbi:MAG: antibiotic biosynthesis monooxygenase [Fimbriimonadaceae bacterium]|nr:antibiotic biosynthesis monooxygenase [Fimbriimonadaceae bacterium]
MTQNDQNTEAFAIEGNDDLGFVAINYITCIECYKERFEQLFKSRAMAIDRIAGFRFMKVLKPQKEDQPYLVLSHWDTEEAFKSWTSSPEFIEGHKRGFEDVRKAKESGQEPPMKSDFATYTVLCN